jgi:uncharacterized protein (DUF736 family)
VKQFLFQPLRKQGDNGPDYRVTVDGPQGSVELGAAWKRKSAKGREAERGDSE